MAKIKAAKNGPRIHLTLTKERCMIARGEKKEEYAMTGDEANKKAKTILAFFLT